MSEEQFKKVRWECTDCSLGEQSKCVYEGLLEYEDETPPQCPQDEHGCGAAKWVRVSTCPPVDSVGVDRVGEIMAYATGALCGLDGTGKGDEGVIEIMLEAERRIAALSDSTGEDT